jgi:hypothetical protein
MTASPSPGATPTAATSAGRHVSTDSRQAELADLEALAAALAERGCQADVVTPEPFVVVRHAGTGASCQLYADGAHFSWPVTVTAGHRADTALAADTIVWALRSQPHARPTPTRSSLTSY